MPPPADGFAVRLVRGPALRTQPDRRLVTLVREGYEAAFEEIVRRYGKPLTRYAAAIVGSRGEDVTQDAFSKALLALRRDDDSEIELRPWLFRIVRNTALNDLRDSPPTPELLADAIAGGRNPAEEMERREDLADLMHRLQSLPDRQRAAIVMRELEGLSHEEIAAALGLSGGAARQAIFRARQTLRDGFGMLLPLPLLRLLVDHAGDAAVVGASGATAAATGGAVGGAGAGMALKAGVVTAVLAGSVGAGIAVNRSDHGNANADAATATQATTAAAADSVAQPAAAAAGPGPVLAEEDHGPSGRGHPGPNRGQGRRGDSRGDNEIGSRHSLAPSGGGPGPSGPTSEHHGRDGHSGEDDHDQPHPSRQSGRGEDHGGGSHSGPGSGGNRSGGEGHSGEEHSGGGRGGSSGRDDVAAGSEEAHGHRGPGGEEPPGDDEVAPVAPPAEEEPQEDENGSGSGSGSGGPGSGGSGSSGRGGGELP
jgi:RNA polymerase sigma factor (sigma-70 family)